MRTIINDTNEKEFIKSYNINADRGGDFTVTAYIKNMGDDVKIKQLEIKKDVIFTFEGKERTEPAVLRFKDTNKKGMLYSYEYEFAGRKFAKNYVKDEYKTEKVLVQALDFCNLYKIVKKKTSFNPTLEEIWAYTLRSKIVSDFNMLTQYFDSCLYDERNLLGKDTKRQTLLAEMFMESLKFDKKKTLNYELNFDEMTFNAKTR